MSPSENVSGASMRFSIIISGALNAMDQYSRRAIVMLFKIIDSVKCQKVYHDIITQTHNMRELQSRMVIISVPVKTKGHRERDS